MNKINETEYCVVHCRVSSNKQSQEGESLHVQRDICIGIAERNGWSLAHEPWLESFSGRKLQRPVFEEVLDFLDSHPGLVKRYIFRAIDRFTRGGAFTYEEMKRELRKRGVEMVDSYGLIQPVKNTLEDLGFEYEWSTQSPSEITEVVVATTAKQEVTNILTRMIGQSIRNTQKGYRTRRATDGFRNQKVFDDSGKKKYIQVPDPERAKFRIAMFDLRCQGLKDEESVRRINAMGYLSPVYNRWNKEHTRIIGGRGGKPMTVKQFQRDIENTIYAGVLCEKWTHYQPVRAQYDGLVTIEKWNRANRGKLAIMEKEDGVLELVRGYPHGKTGKVRNKENPLYPFKFILCPHCDKPMLGSAPRGKLGKPHPTYHCGRNHKYFGVPKLVFEESIKKYIHGLKFNSDMLVGLEATFMAKFRQREQEIVRASGHIHQNIADLEAEQAEKLEAYTSSKSSVVREKLEREIEALEVRIKAAGKERLKIQITRDDIKSFMREAKYIMEHPAEILLNQKDLRVQRDLFGLVFEKMPTYFEILNGTPKLSLVFELSSGFVPDKSQLVTLTIQNSKPTVQEIVESLESITAVARRFRSYQNAGYVPTAIEEHLLA